MIRKKLRLTMTTNLTRSGIFVGAKIQLPNEPLFQIEEMDTSIVRGETIAETIVNYKNLVLTVLGQLNLLNKILITSDNETYIEFDFPSEGAWGGYSDGLYGDVNYLVYENNEWLISKYYSHFEGGYFDATTTIYEGSNVLNPIEQGVIGLDKDNYYIDNDIYVSVKPSDEGVSNYLEMTVTDMQTQRSINTRMYYFNNNTLTFDLAIIVKGLMRAPKTNFDYSNLTPYPINTNYGRYRIQLTRYYTPVNSNVITPDAVTEIQKVFIRGGIFKQANNVVAIEGSVLRNCEKLPIWNGYPTAEYKLIGGEIIQFNDLTNVNKEYRPYAGCNAYYFKFKNRKGGYSYWMFNKMVNEVSASNVGYSNLYGEITDFGSNIDQSHEVSAKIPYAFKELAFDLITSSETYLYEGQNKWSKVIQKSNKAVDNTLKRTFDVSFKFDVISNYNPTI